MELFEIVTAEEREYMLRKLKEKRENEEKRRAVIEAFEQVKKYLDIIERNGGRVCNPHIGGKYEPSRYPRVCSADISLTNLPRVD